MRDLERRVRKLENEREPDDGTVLYWHDEVIETPWSPDDPEKSAPEPGHEYRRYYTNEAGEWKVEEITEEEYREAVR